MKPCQRLRQAFVVTRQPPKTSGPGETALHHPSPWQQDEASLGAWELHYFQPHAFSFGSFCCCFTSVAGINVCQLYVVPSRFLYRLGQLLHLLAVLPIGSGYTHSQKVPQSVYRHMYLAPLAALGSIVSRSCATLRRGLHRAA